MSDPYAAAVSGTAGRSLQLDQILGTLLRQAPDVEAAAVVSFDGLPMASALPPAMDEDRVAAMSAALLSLGERAAQGLGRGDLSQVYVEGDNGTVFLVSADDEAVLVAVGRAGAKVGLMLFEVRQAADAVGAALRVDAAPVNPAVEPLVPQAAVPVQVAQSVAEPVAQSVAEPVAQPVAQPVAEPVAQPVAQPVAESDAEQVEDVEPVHTVDTVDPAPAVEPVNGHQDPVPTVVPDPPVNTEPVRQPVAVPVPREVRESPWDHPSSNGTSTEGDRRPATVAPDGSGWS